MGDSVQKIGLPGDFLLSIKPVGLATYLFLMKTGGGIEKIGGWGDRGDQREGGRRVRTNETKYRLLNKICLSYFTC